jgi:hypothetical protein
MPEEIHDRCGGVGARVRDAFTRPYRAAWGGRSGAVDEPPVSMPEHLRLFRGHP